MLAMISEPTSVTVDTQFRGLIEVPAKQVLRFTAPLLGFERTERFILYQTQEGPLTWLQDVDHKDVSFCLLAPFRLGMAVDMEITPADAVDIGALTVEEIDVYTVVVLDPEPSRIRTNLRAPILVCARTGLAKQLVLGNQRLPIQFFLKDLRLPAHR